MNRATAVQLEVQRRLTAAERLEITAQMCDAMRTLVAAGIRMRNPGWGEDEVRHELLRIYEALAPETAG
ncbi:MAG TPA: hypothetical protein VGM20_08940 [Gemmatimonadales bacterium]|jgi:hypothetical protein